MPDYSQRFHCPGALDALIRPGERPGRAARKSGDGILIDMERRFFAISDSAPRSPGTAEEVLSGILRAMKTDAADPAGITRCEDAEARFEPFKAFIEAELEHVSSFESCTLTGLLIVEGPERRQGILLHTGDSLLFQYSPDQGLVQISQTNFWMVGRSNRLFQAEILDIPPDAVFLMATDGLLEWIYRSKQGLKTLSELIAATTLDDFLNALLKRYGTPHGETDDLGLLIFDPARLPLCNAGFVMGSSNHAADCVCLGRLRTAT